MKIHSTYIMKAKVQSLLILVLIVGAQTIGTTQDRITLDNIIQKVIDSSVDIKLAKNSKKIVRQQNDFYKSFLRPNVRVDASLPDYVKTSAPVVQPNGSIAFQSVQQANSSLGLSASQVLTATGGTLFFDSALTRFDDFSTEFNSYNGVPWRIGISQPLFGFNPWKYDKSIQALSMTEADKVFTVRVENTLLDATSLYFNILIAKQNQEIAATNEQVNQKLLIITEERYALGKVSRDEKLQLEIELNNAKLEASQAGFAYSSAVASLQTFMGAGQQRETLDYEIPQEQQIDDMDEAALIASAFSNRPEVLTYQKELQQADRDMAQTKAQYGLQATVTASFGYARGSQKLSEVYTNPFDEQQANISVSVPILDWGRRKSAVEQVKLQKENIILSYEQQLLELENELRMNTLVFARLQKEIVLLKSIMDKAENRFVISNERYVLGNIDITNLTLAQREKDQSKRSYIIALRDYWVTYYRLRMLSGYDIINNENITY